MSSHRSAEEQVAETIGRYRNELGLTYEQMALRLRAEGVTIHQSAVQKSEKGGRRVPIDEMVAYAKIFRIPVEELWGGTSQEASVAAGWRDFIAAEKTLMMAKRIEREYQGMIENVRKQVSENPELRRQIEERLSSVETWEREMLAYSYENLVPSVGEDGKPLQNEDGTYIHSTAPTATEAEIDAEFENDLPASVLAARDALQVRGSYAG